MSLYECKYIIDNFTSNKMTIQFIRINILDEATNEAPFFNKQIHLFCIFANGQSWEYLFHI